MTDIPTREPEVFTAGDTVKWTKSLSDYRPADGWVLSYAFVLSDALKSVTATDNGDGSHLATIAAADSAAWSAGIWYWQAYVTKASERYRVAEGRVEVKPDFASQATGYDARTHVKQVLDALEAMIAGKASKDQVSYTINGRSLQRLAPEELIQWHSHYKRLYQQEVDAERAALGVNGNGQIQVRFTR